MANLVGLIAAAALVAAPAGDDYKAALADVRALPAELRPQVRYLSFRYLGPDGDPVLCRKLADYHLNALAALDSGGLARVEPAGGALARVQLARYAITPEALTRWAESWEGLAAASYTSHITTQAITPTAEGDGQQIETTTVRGGWIDGASAGQLEAATGSAVPIVDFRVFLAEAMRPAVYYKWAGIGNQNETLAKLGVDPALIEQLRAAHAATIKASDVALGKPRRVHEWRGLFGGAWFTADTNKLENRTDFVRYPLAKISTDQGQDVELLDVQAHEWVLVGRNGLPVFLLTNDKGERLDDVDPRVARDYSERHKRFDAIITTPLSCIRCHTLSGFQPISDYQQTLIARGQVADSPERAARIAEIYRWDLLARQLEYDGQTIEIATRNASGLDWQSVSDGTARVWRQYALEGVDLVVAAAELGLTPEATRPILQGLSDPWARALVAGESIPRESWATLFPQAIIAGGKK